MRYRNSSYASGAFDTFWFEKNLQGDIIAVYDEGGTLLVSYVYDAWGNVATPTYYNNGDSTAAQYNPFRYRGYYYDSELGFYYLNSRYYDPETGRFVNADGFVSTGQGILGYNMFAYCRNEPVFRKDAYGIEDVCATNFDDDNNPLNDLGKSPSGKGSGGGSGKSGGYGSGGNNSSKPSQVTSTTPHGNSKQSTKPQHGYVIKSNNGVEKVGVSGQPLNKNGTSPRANAQVSKFNKAAGYNKYWAEVIITDVPGRGQILIWEENMASYYKTMGEPMSLHKRP